MDFGPSTHSSVMVDPRSGRTVDPPALVSNELIEMIDWELHDFGVKIVRYALLKDGKRIMSSQGNPKVDPSIWFVGASGTEWVVVRAIRHPERDAEPPANWDGIAHECAKLARVGYIASVSIAHAKEPFDSEGAPTPLWRGHECSISYQGLQIPVS